MPSERTFPFVWPMLMLLLAGASSTAQAQHVILSGLVIDAETHAPLPGVNVFLANTTIGAATDAKGRYTLTGVPPGPHEVVASMIGYVSKRVEIAIRPEMSKKRVDFRLQPAVYDLNAVEVAAKRPRSWRRHFKQFEEHFLGNSRNADETEILNPYVLDFERNGGVLIARAAEPLLLENRGLGYRITFSLNAFRLDQKKQMLHYGGYPYFEELKPQRAEEAERWQQNRERAFRGSLQHVLWAMIHDRVLEEGYTLRLDDRINAPASEDIPNFTLVAASDLIEPTDVPYIYTLRFDHYLRVSYESPKRGLSFGFGSKHEPDRQVSWLRMHRFLGRVHESGFLYPPTPVTVSGYLTTKRIADRLPRDFIHQFQQGHPGAVQPSVEASTSQPVVAYETGLLQGPRIHPAEMAVLESVVAAMEEAQWGEAIKRLDPILHRNPDNLEARYYRAIAHREVAKFRTLTEFEHWREGMADFRFILARDSTYRDVLYQYALYCRVPQGQTALRKQNISYTDALWLGHVQVRLRPDVPDHQFHLFTLYRRFLNHTTTEKALAWLRKNPSDFAEYFTGEALRRAGQFTAAADVLAGLLTRPLEMPRQPILLSRARIDYALGQPETAEAFVRQAIAAIERPMHAAFVFEEAKYIVNEEELAAYRSLERPQEYIAFFDAFWARRDPMPARSFNARLAEHYRRLRKAEQDYAFDGYRFWMNNPDKTRELVFPAVYTLNDAFNDKGLVYIRLGEPTDRIVTVGGQASTFKSSLGMTGERPGFLPKDQSYRANWVPNESWRYSSLAMDFHFVIDEGGSGNNWRLTPALTNYEMLRDRMEWGGVYVHMARAAETAEEHRLAPNISGDQASKDRSRESASLEASAVMDMASGRGEMAEHSRAAAERGLTMDRQTWHEDIEPMDFPYGAAAFRGENGLTTLHLYYALPTGLITQEAQTDTLSVELGVALHDTTWMEAVNQTTLLRLPARDDPAAAAIQALQLDVPPDSYHVALHSRPLGTRLLGGYTFEKRLPDFNTPALALSDLLLAYEITPTTNDEPSRRSDLRIMGNPFHRFALEQLVHVYFEIYHLLFGADDLTRYSIEYTLIPQEENQPLRRIFRPAKQPSLTLKMSRRGATISPIEYAEIDVSQLEPGRYMFLVTITDEQSGKSVMNRAPVELSER